MHGKIASFAKPGEPTADECLAMGKAGYEAVKGGAAKNGAVDVKVSVFCVVSLVLQVLFF